MAYDVTIGLEVHVQVRTRTKMFCACPNAFGAEPNTQICPVCMGYPGVLPVPNQEAIRRTILAGMMCDCEIPSYSKFDRKSYFYPDMPKNYQISQYDLPLCLAGCLRIGGKGLSGEPLPDKVIGITRIHLEEDVAKSTHFGTASGIDFNRAGVPLMEIVSEPDMTSADEAYAYLVALKQVMEFADISDCDMEKGQMRCDVNVSLKPAGQTEFGTKIEIKNLNSSKAVHRSLLYEIERQTAALDNGEVLFQQTRGWDDDRRETYLLRSKESAEDYRYFPDPDLMPIIMSAAALEAIRAEVPETPAARRRRFVADYELPDYDAGVLTQTRALADYFETCVASGAPAKKASNWIMVELLRELADLTLTTCPISPESLGELIALIEQQTISGSIAKTVFAEMFATGAAPLTIVKDKGLEQVADEGAISALVRQAIEANPGPADDLRQGNEKALNFLVGQVMKLSKGKANPQLARDAINDELGLS